MIFSDLHAHTNFCDGENSPEEMVKSAIEKGLKRIGLVVHSYTDFDKTYCVTIDGEKAFKKEMARLKIEYKDKIEVLCGVEQDVFSTHPTDGYDYVIGSVHYFKVNGKYYHVDHCPEEFIKTVKERFGGDYFSAAECYFESVSRVKEKTNADIIGHFDVVSKFNQDCCLFDESNPRYLRAWQSAINAITDESTTFEINVGAILRNYRLEPYPNDKMREQIKNLGGKFILSSDAHNKNNIAYNFDKWSKLL